MSKTKKYANRYWKRIWQICSGNNKNVSPEEVEKTLSDSKKEILDGILQFKKTTTQEPENKDNLSEDVFKFICRAAKYLNLDFEVCWELLRSYIIHEYCGSIDTIKKLKYEMQIQPMLHNVWRYYSSERMFIIKTLKTIIEFMNDAAHPYATMYKEFIVTVGYREMWTILNKQFSYLIIEIQANVSEPSGTILRSWVERNIRETVEVLQCLIMLSRYVDVTISDFHELLLSCISHGFGREPVSFDVLNVMEESSLDKLIYSEVALLMCIANRLWNKSDWYTSKTKNINNDIAPLAYRREHGAVCYIWVMMHMMLPDKLTLFDTILNQIMTRAVNLQCFDFFAGMVNHEMFVEANCLASATMQEAMFNMHLIGVNNFDGEGPLFMGVPGAVQMTHVLLKNQHFCERFFTELMTDNHVRIWSSSVENYPMSISTISLLAEAVIVSQSEAVKRVLHDMEHMPWFTDIYEPGIIEHTPRRQTVDSVHTLKPYTPANAPYITIPPNTLAVIRNNGNKTLIHFQYETSYWTGLIQNMRCAITMPGYDDNLLNNITASLKVVLAILKVDREAVRKHQFLMDSTAMLLKLMNKYCTVGTTPFRLIAVCLDICTELLYKFRPYIVSHLENIFMLPSLAKTEFTYEEIFQVNFLEQGKIGHLIVQSERHSEQYMVLISYLNFLRTSFMITDGNLNVVELPGLVFIVKEIFPHFMFWYNKREDIYESILYQCINFLFEMFQLPSETLKAEQFSRMQKIAYQCFLNKTCGKCLLGILSVGNTGIQYMMEGQTNWKAGRGIKYISVIQKAMAILMQLLTVGKKLFDHTGLTPLEHVIYAENGTIKTVQTIASFLNHPFSTAIPTLGCRLLKKFTVVYMEIKMDPKIKKEYLTRPLPEHFMGCFLQYPELQMSMLAALYLDADQVRQMFIQRLRDPLECEQLKLAIIELVTASIPKQPGMTEAFFKMNAAGIDKSTNKSVNEGIGSFLVEYLNTFLTRVLQHYAEPNNPLLIRIMELLHMLWMNQKEILIADIIKDDQFWPSLCCPLFSEVMFNNTTYSQILNIIAKEIHKKTGSIDETLKNVLSKLFSVDEKYFNYWMTYVFAVKDDDGNSESKDISPAGCLVVSWKDFLIVAIKFLPPSFFTSDLQSKLTSECRKALKEHVLNLQDTSVMTFLAELYLFLITNWGDACLKEDHSFYMDITDIVQKVAISYTDLPERFQQAILAIAVLSLRGIHTTTTVMHSALCNILIESVGKIFNFEYIVFCEKFDRGVYDNAVYNAKEHKSLLMCFAALNELLSIQNSGTAEYNQWFGHDQFISKLISCVQKFLLTSGTYPMTKVVLECLIHYAQSANTCDFLQSDISIQLWERLQPPEQFRQPKQLGLMQKLPPTLLEWWTIYKRVTILLTVLLKKHSYSILKDILMFVSLHEDYIEDVLLLERYCVESAALDLIVTVMVFLKELLQYKKAWKNDHNESLELIMDTIKMTLNSSSAVIIRPNVLKYFSLNSAISEETLGNDSFPTEMIVEVIDRLTAIVSLAAECILEFSPPLFAMLRDDTDYSEWPLQVGTSFGLPAFGVDESSELTFGSLICVSCLYVRILSQISYSKKMPQVTSPREILVARKSRLNLQATTTTSKSDDQKKSGTGNTPEITETKQKKTEEEPSTIDKESQFCFSQVKRMAITKRNTDCVRGFIRIDFLNPMCSLSAVQNFATYASPIKSFPWFTKLNEDKATRALESVLTLLGSQVSLILCYNALVEREERLIKRELCSELQTFHDFMKKRLIETHRYSTADRTNLLRKKFGIVEEKETEQNKETTIKKKVTFESNDDSVAVNFRSLPSKRSLEISGISSLVNSPKVTKPVRNDINQQTTKDVKANGLFEVKLISEDYLHFLSLWYMHVLHSSKDK